MSYKKVVMSFCAAGLLFCSSSAHALSFAPNSEYTLNGTLGLVLMAEGTGTDLFTAINIVGTITSSGLSGPNAISQISVNYNISQSNLTLASNHNTVVGSITGGSGFMAYNNAALINGPTGTVAGVFFDDGNASTPQDLSIAQGSGAGTLGAFGVTVQGTLNGQAFNDSVNLDAKSQFLGNHPQHGPDYAPLSGLGAFAASFGDLGGFASSFHGWVMSSFLVPRGAPGSNSFFFDIGGVQYRVAGDFHGSISPSNPGNEIPEPASLLLLSVAGAGLMRRRKQLA